MKLRPLIGITLLAFLIVVITIAAMECQGITTTEANDMTTHKFPAARNLAEVVGQDRYTMAQLSERLGGIIRRGVVSRVRPTGEGFEYTFPEGVDAVYLVDVEIYNPGARPVTLEGIESAIPVRPGQGVRVLIPGGDVTRGPIVMGRLTPHEADIVGFNRFGPTVGTVGQYPTIGWTRTWVVDVRVEEITLATTFAPPPTTPELHYPESVTARGDIEVSIATGDDTAHTIVLPIGGALYMQSAGGSVNYAATRWQQQYVVEIDEVADLLANNLTKEMPVDVRSVGVSLAGPGVINQSGYRGNQDLETVSETAADSYDYFLLSITMSELGVGTK